MAEQVQLDNHGNVVEIRLYNEANKSYQIFRYEQFDEKGNHKIEKVHDPNGNLKYYIAYIYDKKGTVHYITLYTPHHVNHKEHAYNFNGQLVIDYIYSSKGKPRAFHTYEYNDKGLIVAHSYTKRFKLVWRYTFEYCPKGYLCEKRMYDGKNRLDWAWKYSHSETGEEISRQLYCSDGNLIEKWDFEYRNGKLARQYRYCPEL